ncbi:hypothetical protein Pmani_028818 [Petrolisthes manimaculis]|uniref:Uncharacterized protein n=1 Tax=Petrolisthes manimaculis TaxID=1843537 RepID=A0AAE1P1B9_9EUCA|nr:hypothetical protein Pmani_028818 [Petrolisthes manimaculis]
MVNKSQRIVETESEDFGQVSWSASDYYYLSQMSQSASADYQVEEDQLCGVQWLAHSPSRNDNMPSPLCP